MTELSIPLITDPLGKYWDQPKLSEINIGGRFAHMSQSAFKQLAEYSTSIPTGTYIGKMWKRNQLTEGWKPTKKWYLCWYGPNKDPGMLSINYKEIVITDQYLPNGSAN